MEWLLIGGLAAYLWFKNQKDAFAAGFRVGVSDVGFDFKKSLESLFLKLWFNVTLKVDNPSDVAVKATGGSFSLSQGATVLGSAVVRGEAAIPAKQSAPIKFYVGIPLKGGVTIVKTIINKIKDQQTVTLGLNGFVSLNVGNLKFNKSLSI